MPKITILNAILHSVDRAGVHLSESKLDTDSETCIEYIKKHINPLFSAAAAREATFRSESQVYPVIQRFQKGDMHFTELGRTLGGQLGELLQLEDDTSVCTILIVEFVSRKTRYLSIHQIACEECFAHKIIEEDEKAEIQLYKNMTVLPAKGGDACLIPLEGEMILRILCKSGSDFLAESFLGCEWSLSKKELGDIITDAIVEVVDTFFEGNLDAATAVKQAVIDQAPDEHSDDIFRLESVASRAFPENPEAAKKLVDIANEAGFPYDPPITKSFAQKTYGKQEIKFESGLEVKMPLDVAIDAGSVELISNEDGTVDIRIKRQRLAAAK